MASVTSLDKDLRNMRLSKYTPQAANEVRDWIEEVLRQRLPSGDLLDALKDGVALCKYEQTYLDCFQNYISVILCFKSLAFLGELARETFIERRILRRGTGREHVYCMQWVLEKALDLLSPREVSWLTHTL